MINYLMVFKKVPINYPSRAKKMKNTAKEA